MDSFNFLLSLGNESLEIFKPDFDARERLLDALELDADIFVVARALEDAYAPVSYTHLTLPTSDLV